MKDKKKVEQLVLAENYLGELGMLGGRATTMLQRATDVIAYVRAALESEKVVAEGWADPDALADYNAGRIHMLTIFKVQALYTDKPVRVLAVKEDHESANLP